MPCEEYITTSVHKHTSQPVRRKPQKGRRSDVDSSRSSQVLGLTCPPKPAQQCPVPTTLASSSHTCQLPRETPSPPQNAEEPGPRGSGPRLSTLGTSSLWCCHTRALCGHGRSPPFLPVTSGPSLALRPQRSEAPSEGVSGCKAQDAGNGQVPHADSKRQRLLGTGLRGGCR